MKTYTGTRLDPEGCEVYVTTEEGRKYPLPLFTEIRNHSPTGFEWGYGGSGPAQLALAILADHFGADSWPRCCPYCHSRMDGYKCVEPECAYDAREDQFKSIQGEVVHYQDFKRDIVCQFSKPGFLLTSLQIDDWVRAHAKRPCNK